MKDVIEFKCPACKLQCRLSQRQRALQHQVPDCMVWLKHKRAGDLQEFLRLALMSAGGAAFELGSATIDVELTSEEKAIEQRPRAAPAVRPLGFSERERKELIEEIAEGVKKL